MQPPQPGEDRELPHVPAPPAAEERVSAPAAHGADDGRAGRGDLRLRPAAHHRRRLVRRRRGHVEHAAGHAQRDLADLSAAAELRRAHARVEGVSSVSWSNWFGGVYITERNFFPQFAVEPASYLALYPEYLLNDDEKKAFLRDRQGAVVGRKLAEQVRLEGRRPDPAARHDLPRHLDLHAARHLGRRRRQDRRGADAASTGSCSPRRRAGCQRDEPTTWASSSSASTNPTTRR